MLLRYLQQNYKPNEPIFLADIDLPVSDTNLRQMVKMLCDSGKLERFDTGIYYMKSPSRLVGGTVLSAEEVANFKYINRQDRIDGYYSGYTFANQLGLTTQVPVVIEIVSNQASARCREITLQYQRIMLRRPRVEVNRENYCVLQLLDLLKDLDLYVDEDVMSARDRIVRYIREMSIRKTDVDRYISLFPDKVYRYIYEMRLYDVFA